MQEYRLWLLNHIGNAFTISSHQNKYTQLNNTWDEAVTVKRVSATSSCAWAISHNHRVYIYVFSSDVPIRIADTTYENQRWSPIHGFSPKSLIPTDRKAWSNESGIGDRPKESVRLPSPHWQWEGDWFIDDNLRGEVVGIEGWQYALDFPSLYTPEKHWNSFVRKRKWIRFRHFVATNVWARVSDMEVADKAECFIDISVGGFLLPTKIPGTLAVWGVTNNGNIYVRTNARHDNPEGDSWNQIGLNGQNGVVNISVGVSNLVWGITWDGQALARTNVTRNNIYGTSWELVDYPNEDTRLMQVAVGHNSVWALSREGTVWFRKGTWGDDMYGNTQSTVGTMWVEMVGQMVHIAISANDQVFAIEKNTKEILFRTGITHSDLTGKTWQTVTLEEDISFFERDGRISTGVVCSCCDDYDSTCEYHRSFQQDLSLTRSSSSTTSQINMEGSSSNVFLTPTESSQSLSCSFDDSDTKNMGVNVDRDEGNQFDLVNEANRIPLFSLTDSPPLNESSAQNLSETAGSGIPGSKNNFHSEPNTAAETKTLPNHKTIPTIESAHTAKDEIVNTSLSQTTILSSSPVSITLESTLSKDSSSTVEYSSNSETKNEKAEDAIESPEIDSQKYVKNKKLKNSKNQKKSQENSPSDIVFQGKKKQRLKQRKSHKNEISDTINSPSADEKLYEPLSLTCIENNEKDKTAMKVDAALLENSNSKMGQLSNDSGCINVLSFSSEPPSEISSHLSCGNGDSTDNANTDVQDILDFVLSPESPSMKGETITVDTVKNENMTIDTSENLVSAQINVQDSSVSDSSLADTPKITDTECSHYSHASFGSLDSSSASDEIIDFVTDLMSDEEENQEVFVAKDVEEEVSPQDSMDSSKVASSQIEENITKVIDSCPLQSHPLLSMTQKCDGPVAKPCCSPPVQPEIIRRQSSFAVSQIHRSSSAGFDSSCSESNSATVPFYTIDQAQPRRAWRWLDVTSCLIENPSAVPWLDSKPQGSKTKSKKTVEISPALRNDILAKLKDRNKREIQPFSNIEAAVEKETWVKRTQMHLHLYGHHSRWMPCSVELEQGISNVKEGCLTLQYCHKKSQKHIQVKNDEMVCVKMSSNLDDQSTFFIYPANSKVIYQPLMLRAASEEEALEWVGYLCLANSHVWTVYQPILPGVAWSCSSAGHVFVSIDISNCDKPCDLCWIQHGGHMSLIETGPSGVTWALGFDHMPYVYNGGYGGAYNIGTTGMNDNLQEITDYDRVYVYENQKWFPVIGWCNKGVLYGDFHWLTPSGKSVASRNDIKLPSSKWHWMGDWTVDFNSPGGVNSKGWQFSTSLYGHFHSHQHIKDYYRRRRWTRTCRLTTQGPWQMGGALKLLDISVQIDPVSSNTDPVLVWAVGANGNVLCRCGVTMLNPEGDSWNHVATFLDKPYRSISVGGGYRVWGVASDGSAWFRTEVSPKNPSGERWSQVVPPPPGNSLLKQVSAGATAVWAVDTKDGLWRRENITITFPEGTGWEYVISKVKCVSVGPHDQVWIVAGAGFSRYKHEAGVVYKRVGISEKKPSGTDWTAVIGFGWSHVSVRGMT